MRLLAVTSSCYILRLFIERLLNMLFNLCMALNNDAYSLQHIDFRSFVRNFLGPF